MNDYTETTTPTDGQNSATLLGIIIWILLAGIVVFLYFQLYAQHQSNASFSDVSGAVLNAAVTDSMYEADNQLIKRSFGLSPTQVDEVLYYAPLSNMDSTEILLVKLSDMSMQSTVQAAMEQRIADQIDIFEGYAPEQVAMLEKAVVCVEGNYLLYVSADDPATVVAAFKRAL